MKKYLKPTMLIIFSILLIIVGIELNEPGTIKGVGSYLCYGCLGF